MIVYIEIKDIRFRIWFFIFIVDLFVFITLFVDI